MIKLTERDEAPAYRERAEKLIEEIKHLVSSYMEGSGADDLIKRIQIVDLVHCLGIDRHFQHEMTGALDYLYRLRIYVHFNEFRFYRN